MEGVLLFIAIFAVLIVGGWLLETISDGVASGLVALVSAPFKAARRARAKREMELFVNGVSFSTSSSVADLHHALSGHFRNGQFHPGNDVLVQVDEIGRHVIGIAWNKEVKFHLTDGTDTQTVQGSGIPVVVVEVTYEPAGLGSVGRMRLTRFPHDPDWTDKALMDSAIPWCFEPISGLDSSARLNKEPSGYSSSSLPRTTQRGSIPPRDATASAEIRPQHDSVRPMAAISRDTGAARPTPALHFNAPPNWPVPPGWSPPRGWSPDPSWPPAPTGWRFWT